MATPTSTQNGVGFSDRERMKGWTNKKDQLERELKLGQNKAFYLKTLTDRGFNITSVNTSKADAAEYEVVKGNQTYEVQIGFDNAGKATEVDVTTNMWRTDATKAAMKGEKVPMATGFVKAMRPSVIAPACRPGPTRRIDWRRRLPWATRRVTTVSS